MQNSIAKPITKAGAWTLGPSLFDSIFPEAKTWHKVAALVALVALIALCAKARFYLPGNPTPVTMQTFGVLFAGSLMGWRWGTGAVLAYIAIGTLGAPVFAGTSAFDFRSPADAWNYTIMGVTGGYIIGFLVASFVAGWMAQLGFNKRDALWANLAGGLLLYLPALIWLSAFDFSWPAADRFMMDAMYIYMPGDMFKILAASLLTWGLWSRFANRDAR